MMDPFYVLISMEGMWQLLMGVAPLSAKCLTSTYITRKPQPQNNKIYYISFERAFNSVQNYI